ncbi:MAG: haloalkane dehalogenase [Actinomycetota bacterium]|nr:haloalkane dehalogenase [Actinomycetota bacterium]
MNEQPLSKRYQAVHGKRIAFHERGAGDAIVFLHGNPTSSYLWRNVIPHVADQGRCIAPDLIGMGDSDKLGDSGPDSYTYLEHRRYLDGFLERVELGERVTFVVHDWGSALGFDWACRHPDRVAGIAYMEAIVAPVDNLDDWGETAASFFRALRSDAGEELVLERNVFVEGALPAGVMRELSEEEMAEYRRPFAEPGEDRRPTLSWPRQVPIEGEPAELVEIVERYGERMAEFEIPKLFINGDPGAILIGRPRDLCRAWPVQTEVTVPGLHYLQEDSPDLIGQALSEWLTAR